LYYTLIVLLLIDFFVGKKNMSYMVLAGELVSQ